MKKLSARFDYSIPNDPSIGGMLLDTITTEVTNPYFILMNPFSFSRLK